MNCVLPGPEFTASLLALAGHNKKSKKALFHQFFKHITYSVSGPCSRFISHDIDTMLVLKVILEVTP